MPTGPLARTLAEVKSYTDGGWRLENSGNIKKTRTSPRMFREKHVVHSVLEGEKLNAESERGGWLREEKGKGRKRERVDAVLSKKGCRRMGLRYRGGIRKSGKSKEKASIHKFGGWRTGLLQTTSKLSQRVLVTGRLLWNMDRREGLGKRPERRKIAGRVSVLSSSTSQQRHWKIP